MKTAMIISIFIVFIYFVVEIEDNTSTKNTYNTDFKITNDRKIRFDSLTFNFSPEDIANKAYNIIDSIKSGLLTPNAVSIVKSGKIDETLNIDEWVSGLVGIRGKLNWKEFNPEDHDSRIKIVQLDMVREDGRNAKIQWEVNTDTKFYNIKYIELNGEEKSVLTGVMELELWPVGDLFRMFQ